MTKRIFDITFAFIILLLLLPIFCIVSVLIIYNLGFPLFHKATRVGKENRKFKIYKFRTMDIAADIPKNNTMNFLRKTNLDELPQFLNVLLGHMSVVGPRPHDLNEDILFENKIKNYHLRKKVLPGITGLSAIKGNRGGNDIEFISRRVEYDLQYIENQSFFFDLFIIFKTIITIFKPNH